MQLNQAPDSTIPVSVQAFGGEGVGRGPGIPGPLMGRRRRFTNDEKRRFLVEAAGPGESMSSVGRRYGLSVSLLFRWRRQLDGAGHAKARPSEDTVRAEVRELRDRIRELERLLGRKTLESELLKQELSRLGHNPTAALDALDAQGAPR